MRGYVVPDVAVVDVGEIAGNLLPDAELSYCFEEFDVGGDSGYLEVNICVDRNQWPGFDGSGSDQIDVSIWQGSNFMASVTWEFIGGAGTPVWCYTYSVSVSPNEYTVRARLIVDGEEVCRDEQTGTVFDD